MGARERRSTLATALARGRRGGREPRRGRAHSKTYSILDLVYQVADFYNLDKSLINPVTSASLKQPAKRPLVTGFDIDKAKRDLDYKPVDFEEGIKIMHQQIKKYEV